MVNSINSSHSTKTHPAFSSNNNIDINAKLTDKILKSDQKNYSMEAGKHNKPLATAQMGDEYVIVKKKKGNPAAKTIGLAAVLTAGTYAAYKGGLTKSIKPLNKFVEKAEKNVLQGAKIAKQKGTELYKTAMNKFSKPAEKVTEQVVENAENQVKTLSKQV